MTRAYMSRFSFIIEDCLPQASKPVDIVLIIPEKRMPLLSTGN